MDAKRLSAQGSDVRKLPDGKGLVDDETGVNLDQDTRLVHGDDYIMVRQPASMIRSPPRHLAPSNLLERWRDGRPCAVLSVTNHLFGLFIQFDYFGT